MTQEEKKAVEALEQACLMVDKSVSEENQIGRVAGMSVIDVVRDAKK